jgi:hypothetical protein
MLEILEWKEKHELRQQPAAPNNARDKALPAIPRKPERIAFPESQLRHCCPQVNPGCNKISQQRYVSPSLELSNTSVLQIQLSAAQENLLQELHNRYAVEQTLAINAIYYKQMIAAYQQCWNYLIHVRKENVKLRSILAIQVDVSWKDLGASSLANAYIFTVHN